MQQITLRVGVRTLAELEREARDLGRTRSEHIRDVLESRHEHEQNTDELHGRVAELESERDDLRDRVEAREDRIEDLEGQLRERSRVEDKIEDLPDKIRSTGTYQERRQRLLDQASLAERLKWKVTGVPVDRLDDDGGEEPVE
jgi:DNA repair exonuclease SbcCD ATPase subunit